MAKKAKSSPKPKDPPGVIIYYENRIPLNLLSAEQRGRLFSAILAYGDAGEIPDFSDDLPLAISWAFMQDKVDKDQQKYKNRSINGKRAADCRWGNLPDEADSVSEATEDANACGRMQPHTNYNDNSNSNSSSTQLQHSAFSSPGAEADFERMRKESIRLLTENTQPAPVIPIESAAADG